MTASSHSTSRHFLQQRFSTQRALLGLLQTQPNPAVEELVARGHRLLIIGGDMSLIREAMALQVANAKACLS